MGKALILGFTGWFDPQARGYTRRGKLEPGKFYQLGYVLDRAAVWARAPADIYFIRRGRDGGLAPLVDISGGLGLLYYLPQYSRVIVSGRLVFNGKPLNDVLAKTRAARVGRVPNIDALFEALFILGAIQVYVGANSGIMTLATITPKLVVTYYPASLPSDSEEHSRVFYADVRDRWLNPADLDAVATYPRTSISGEACKYAKMLYDGFSGREDARLPKRYDVFAEDYIGYSLAWFVPVMPKSSGGEYYGTALAYTTERPGEMTLVKGRYVGRREPIGRMDAADFLAACAKSGPDELAVFFGV